MWKFLDNIIKRIVGFFKAKPDLEDVHLPEPVEIVEPVEYIEIVTPVETPVEPAIIKPVPAQIKMAKPTVTVPGRPQLRKALIAGINTYPGSPLRGCVNDALLMYKLISEKYNFKTDNIRLLTDKECTKKNLLKYLKELTMNVMPGDYIFFHYSGHGSQVTVSDWNNNAEPDGMDEILCPIDLNWNDPLRDNDLGAFFNKLPQDVKILIILDSCHSGTGLRNTWKTAGDQSKKDWINKFIPPPPSNILSNPKISLDDALNFVVPRMVYKNGFMVDTALQGDAILIAGCKDSQTSADAFLGGRYQGALTYMLVKSLVENNYKMTYRDLITDINNKLSAMDFDQSPQLEAKLSHHDKEFLV